MADGFDEITEDVVRLAEETYALFLQGDLAFFDRLDMDVEMWVSETFPHGGSLHGESEAIEFWEAVGELFEDAGPHLEELIPAGDRLLLLGTWRASVRRTGDRVEARFAHLTGWRDGKLAELLVHMDTAKVLQALEGPDGS